MDDFVQLFVLTDIFTLFKFSNGFKFVSCNVTTFWKLFFGFEICSDGLESELQSDNLAWFFNSGTT